MTEYVCHKCGVKTTLHRFLDRDFDGIPTVESCPVCGESDDFEYL